MKLSRTMIIQWLTLIAAALALPQLVALIPEHALGYIIVVSGALQLTVKWLEQQADAITLMAVLTLVAGLLSAPELVAVIPPQYANYVALATSILSLITRANQSSPPLKLLLFKTEV